MNTNRPTLAELLETYRERSAAIVDSAEQSELDKELQRAIAGDALRALQAIALPTFGTMPYAMRERHLMNLAASALERAGVQS